MHKKDKRHESHSDFLTSFYSSSLGSSFSALHIHPKALSKNPEVNSHFKDCCGNFMAP